MQISSGKFVEKLLQHPILSIAKSESLKSKCVWIVISRFNELHFQYSFLDKHITTYIFYT